MTELFTDVAICEYNCICVYMWLFSVSSGWLLPYLGVRRRCGNFFNKF